MVFVPLKSTCSQSGKAYWGGASSQPPPAPQLRPLLSPLLTAPALKPEPATDEALAMPPFVASATLVPTGTALYPQASTSASLLQPSTEALMSTLILFVVTAEKVSFFQTRLFPLTLPVGTLTQADPSQYWTLKPVRP